MDASKEHARVCVLFVRSLIDSRVLSLSESSNMDFVLRFLEAAARKLPTEAAYDRDRVKHRRRT